MLLWAIVAIVAAVLAALYPRLVTGPQSPAQFGVLAAAVLLFFFGVGGFVLWEVVKLISDSDSTQQAPRSGEQRAGAQKPSGGSTSSSGSNARAGGAASGARPSATARPSEPRPAAAATAKPSPTRPETPRSAARSLVGTRLGAEQAAKAAEKIVSLRPFVEGRQAATLNSIWGFFDISVPSGVASFDPQDKVVQDLKAKLNRLRLLMHPDKNGHPEAEPTFKFLEQCHQRLVGAFVRRAGHASESVQQRTRREEEELKRDEARKRRQEDERREAAARLQREEDERHERQLRERAEQERKATEASERLEAMVRDKEARSLAYGDRILAAASAAQAAGGTSASTTQGVRPKSVVTPPRATPLACGEPRGGLPGEPRLPEPRRRRRQPAFPGPDRDAVGADVGADADVSAVAGADAGPPARSTRGRAHGEAARGPGFAGAGHAVGDGRLRRGLRGRPALRLAPAARLQPGLGVLLQV